MEEADNQVERDRANANANQPQIVPRFIRSLEAPPHLLLEAGEPSLVARLLQLLLRVFVLQNQLVELANKRVQLVRVDALVFEHIAAGAGP